ncbi:MAG: hypothetical protein ACOYU3_05340 [Bacillota bacterium]
MAKNNDIKKGGKKKTKDQGGPQKVEVQSSSKDTKQSVLMDDA